MALSNLLNEPRREIIEHLLGAGVVIGLGVGDYFCTRWIGMNTVFDTIVGMLLLPMLAIIAVIFFVSINFLIHAIGESISNIMADWGFDPRPKQRYRR